MFRFLLLSVVLSCSSIKKNDSVLSISREEYQKKVYASWIGQMVGNIYGLPHENRYIQKPGEETFPYGYGKNLALLEKYDGGFSDDDTDIEYIYLTAMEKFGPSPKYKDLVELWKYHIRDKVWLANRAALGKMHYGLLPPLTGKKEFNPHWFQIDPQLVNEIWSVTAPGMVKYSIKKSAWAAKITSDDWGIEPTIFYAAMYSQAFFERDHLRLLKVGLDSLKPSMRFRQTIEKMMELYYAHPNDWKRAREIAKEIYYDNEPEETKTIWNANLNGAMAVLALLYGRGDFQKTLDLACALGFDADNQAATLSGLLALAKGIESIPKELLFPFPEKNWNKPFNDKYKNITRFGLPDVKISDLTNRISSAGEKIILSKGGSINDLGSLEIPHNADFWPELEISTPPFFEFNVGVEVSQDLFASDEQLIWAIKGDLPQGLKLEKDGRISGVPEKPGVYKLILSAQSLDKREALKDVKIFVFSENIAKNAISVISNIKETNQKWREQINLTIPFTYYSDNIEIIRDGKKYGRHSGFYLLGSNTKPKKDYFGYEFSKERSIGAVSLTFGPMEESSGWVRNISVQYLNTMGHWEEVKNLSIYPEINFENQPYNKAPYAQHLLFFNPVKTRGLRVVTTPGGVKSWDDREAFFTSLSEMEVFLPMTKRHASDF